MLINYFLIAVAHTFFVIININLVYKAKDVNKLSSIKNLLYQSVFYILLLYLYTRLMLKSNNSTFDYIFDIAYYIVFGIGVYLYTSKLISAILFRRYYKKTYGKKFDIDTAITAKYMNDYEFSAFCAYMVQIGSFIIYNHIDTSNPTKLDHYLNKLKRKRLDLIVQRYYTYKCIEDISLEDYNNRYLVEMGKELGINKKNLEILKHAGTTVIENIDKYIEIHKKILSEDKDFFAKMLK